MSAPAIHLTGRVVLGDDNEVGEAWVIGGRLTLERPGHLPADTVTLSGFALPGLTDAHCHIGLGPVGAVDRDTALAQAKADRDSGVLAVRDAGSPADTRGLDERSDSAKILRAGWQLARTTRELRDYGLERADPDDLAPVVAQQAARGDGWIKLVGDWIDRSEGDASDLRPLWTLAQLQAAVTAAHGAGARVTVHTFATEAIPDLLAAGVDCLEHGTGLLPEHLPTLVDRGIAVTPTLLQVGRFEEIASQGDGKYPVFSARMRRLYARRYEQVRMLYEAGVHLLVGTDAGGTIGHGRIADECAELVRAGVPDAEVVAFASWRGRAFVGAETVGEGSAADLVLYAEDPRADVRELAAPEAVVLGGRIVA